MGHIAPGLKALVIIMGILIVAGLAVLAVTIVQRAGEADFGRGSGYLDARVVLPAGSRVVAMHGEGDAVTLLVESANGDQSLVTVDRRTGERLGTLTLGAAP